MIPEVGLVRRVAGLCEGGRHGVLCGTAQLILTPSPPLAVVVVLPRIVEHLSVLGYLLGDGLDVVQLLHHVVVYELLVDVPTVGLAAPRPLHRWVRDIIHLPPVTILEPGCVVQ